MSFQIFFSKKGTESGLLGRKIALQYFSNLIKKRIKKKLNIYKKKESKEGDVLADQLNFILF